MNVVPTDLNRQLSRYLRNRAAAGQYVVAGRACFWRLVGVGLITFGLGTVVGIGFYGYSFLTRNSENVTSLASTFSKALAEAQLHAVGQGTVQLEPHEIRLAKDETITLDSKSRVLLDPAAKVNADGELTVHVPSVYPTSSAARPRAGNNTPMITNFTVFKKVPFDKGDVMTGWVFLTSTQKSPTEQYCYYTENAEAPGVDVALDLGRNQQPERPKTVPKDFDIAAAFSRCVWFRS